MSVELEDLEDLSSQFAGWDESDRMAYSYGKNLAQYAVLATREGKPALAQKFWAKLRKALTELRALEMEEYDERAKEMQKGAHAGSTLGNAGHRVDRDKAGRRKVVKRRGRRDPSGSDVEDLRTITERHVGWFSDRVIAYDYGYALARTAAAAQRAGNKSRAERFWLTLQRAEKALTSKPALAAQLRSGAMTGAAHGRAGRAASGTQLRAVTSRRDASKPRRISHPYCVTVNLPGRGILPALGTEDDSRFATRNEARDAAAKLAARGENVFVRYDQSAMFKPGVRRDKAGRRKRSRR